MSLMMWRKQRSGSQSGPRRAWRLWLTWLQAKTSSEKVVSRQRKRLRLLAIPLPVAGLILAVLVPGRSFILAGEGGIPATARAAGGGYPIPPCPKWALGNPELPSPRARALVAFDPALGQLVLYGGQPALCQVTKSLRRNLNETWLWNGHRWLSTDPQGSPVDSPVEGGMVYDSRLHEMVMVAWLSSPNLQTWLFNGKRWRELRPKVSPPTGLVHLSYDAATGDVILLSVGTTNAVWTFNGQGWVPGPSLPSSTSFFPLATVYDPTLRSVIAVGRSGTGEFEALLLAKETWEHLETRGLLPALEPTILQLAMAFDQRLNEVVVYYGSNPASPLVDETWVLRGKDWVQLRTIAEPSARRLSSLACLDEEGDLVLFGGVSAARFYNDLWRFNETGWVRVSYTAA